MTCSRCAELDLLREQIAVLREIVGLTFPVPAALKLTPQEAKIYAVLFKRDCLTKVALEALLYSARPNCDRPQTNTINVFICNVRKKCARFGIKIESPGVGRGDARYWMPAESKRIARELAQAQFIGTPLQ